MKFLFSLVSLMLSFQVHADVCGRTPEVRLMLEQITKLNCSEIYKEDLEQIKNFSLLYHENMNLRSLKPNDLEGLINLEGLHIQSAPLLTSLPEGFLNGLSKLKDFTIMQTSITTLPESLFWGLESLSSIYLELNSLTVLPPELLKDLPNLRYVTLADNNLTTLPDGFFSKVKLKGAYCRNNPWAVFSSSTFRGAHMEVLSLHSENATLTTLPENLFHEAEFLESIFIGFPKLVSIPEKLFNGREELKAIWIEDTKIKQLPENLFSGLSNIVQIKFAGNPIRRLPEELFSGLSSLEHLDLSGNWLEEIPLYTFKDLKNLKTLRLNNNALESLPTSLNLFDDLVVLRELFLNNNKAEWTEEAMRYLKDRLYGTKIWF